MIITSFYSNALYEGQAKRLRDSADALGLKCMIHSVPHEKRLDIVRRKARHLIRIRAEHPGHDLMWVDADAVIHEKPAVDAPPYAGIAAVLQFNHTVIPGTIWIRAGTPGNRALAEWQAIQVVNPEWNDCEALSELRRRHGGRMFYGLPPSFNWVERWHRRRFPGGKPVIEHYAIGTGLARSAGKT